MSKRPSTGVFRESSSAKDFIRSTFDREIIKAFKQEHYPEHRLSYLGLPGEFLLDILSWREFLGHATAIEGASDRDVRQDLELRIQKNRLEDVVNLVYGNIDDILRSESAQEILKFPYHIINLDYCGGLVHKTNDNISNRLESIRSLLGIQEGTAFVLFLTVNLKDKDRREMDDLMDELEIRLESPGLNKLGDCFREHRDLGNAGRLKIYAPVFLMNSSPKFTFDFSPPILYQGTKQMMHFAVRCVPYSGLAAGRIIVPDDYINVINQPLLLSHEREDLRRHDLSKIEVVA